MSLVEYLYIICRGLAGGCASVAVESVKSRYHKPVIQDPFPASPSLRNYAYTHAINS